MVIQEAHALLFLGDSVTTDHISPAGSIARNSPAARYLAARGSVGGASAVRGSVGGRRRVSVGEAVGVGSQGPGEQCWLGCERLRGIAVVDDSERSAVNE